MADRQVCAATKSTARCSRRRNPVDMPSAATRRKALFQTCAIVADFDFGHFLPSTVAFPKTVHKFDSKVILLSRLKQHEHRHRPHKTVVLHHHWAAKI
jgi:hypothetical protein